MCNGGGGGGEGGRQGEEQGEYVVKKTGESVSNVQILVGVRAYAGVRDRRDMDIFPALTVW
jgi:hypothetical protein